RSRAFTILPYTTLFRSVPTDPKIPYDVHELITTLTDEGSIQEFKEEFGASITTCFARIEGHEVGEAGGEARPEFFLELLDASLVDRKSTRLNSNHVSIP